VQRKRERNHPAEAGEGLAPEMCHGDVFYN
jgi:hypothetical protein